MLRIAVVVQKAVQKRQFMKDVIRGCLLALLVLILAVLMGGCRKLDEWLGRAAYPGDGAASAAGVVLEGADPQAHLGPWLALVQQADAQQGGKLAERTDLRELTRQMLALLTQERVAQGQWPVLLPELVRQYTHLAEEVRIPEADDRLALVMERAARALRRGEHQELEAELGTAAAIAAQGVQQAESQLRRAHRQMAAVLAARGHRALSRMAWDEGAALLEKAFEQRRVDPQPQTVQWLVEAGQAWQRAGRADRALRLLTQAGEEAAKGRADPAWRDVQLQSFSRLAEVQQARGDLRAAHQSFSRVVALYQELLATELVSDEMRGKLANSLDGRGDVLRVLGDLAGALGSYQESLALRQALSRGDAAGLGSLRDVSVSHNRVGDVMQAMGRLDAAQKHYLEGQQIMNRLVAGDPQRAQWQRDLALSHDRMGDVLKAKRELPAALGSYLQGLQIRKQLAAAQPVGVEWRLDVVISCWKIFQLGSAAGDVEQRRAWLATGLGILRDLKARGQLSAAHQEWLKLFEQAAKQLGPG